MLFWSARRKIRFEIFVVQFFFSNIFHQPEHVILADAPMKSGLVVNLDDLVSIVRQFNHGAAE